MLYEPSNTHYWCMLKIISYHKAESSYRSRRNRIVQNKCPRRSWSISKSKHGPLPTRVTCGKLENETRWKILLSGALNEYCTRGMRDVFDTLTCRLGIRWIVKTQFIVGLLGLGLNEGLRLILILSSLRTLNVR